MSYPIRKIQPNDHQVFLQTLSVPFGLDPSPTMTDRFEIALKQADLSAAFDGEQMVSTFGSYRLNLTIPGGAIVPTAGTTVVTVLTTHRRQGILRAHMKQHFLEAKERGQCLAALWASESHIYGRFGYGPATETVHLTVQKPHAKLRDPVDIRGQMKLVNLEEALKIFPAVYASVARQRPGMFERTTDWWKIRGLADSEELRRGASAHRRVLHVRDREPLGYALYRTRTDYSNFTTELILIELIGKDAAAERALWQYLFGVDLVAKLTYGNMPVDDPLLWWIEQPRELHRKTADAVWVRPVDLIEALQQRRYASAGEIVFRFQDELCPWNDGTFRLRVDANGCGCCEPTTSPPQLHLTPFIVGSVYLAGHRVRELATAGLITGSPEAIAQADAMFAWSRKPWCQEIF